VASVLAHGFDVRARKFHTSHIEWHAPIGLHAFNHNNGYTDHVKRSKYFK